MVPACKQSCFGHYLQLDSNMRIVPYVHADHTVFKTPKGSWWLIAFICLYLEQRDLGPQFTKLSHRQTELPRWTFSEAKRERTRCSKFEKNGTSLESVLGCPHSNPSPASEAASRGGCYTPLFAFQAQCRLFFFILSKKYYKKLFLLSIGKGKEQRKDHVKMNQTDERASSPIMFFNLHLLSQDQRTVLFGSGFSLTRGSSWSIQSLQGRTTITLILDWVECRINS